MRCRFLQMCLVLILASSSFARANEQQKNPPVDPPIVDPVTILSRMTLVVRDADIAKRFYSEGLGYQIKVDQQIDSDWVRKLLQLQPRQTVRFVVLGNSQIIEGEKREAAGIGLMQIGAPGAPVMTRPDNAGLASGEAMMAMRTSDIETVYRNLQKIGATILVSPTRSDNGLEQELVVRDPDGVRLHIVQRPDKK
jgi:catechol 2,3-dioxygenase-like lactoylglutathione lyase family enzyme